MHQRLWDVCSKWPVHANLVHSKPSPESAHLETSESVEHLTGGWDKCHKRSAALWCSFLAYNFSCKILTH